MAYLDSSSYFHACIVVGNKVVVDNSVSRLRLEVESLWDRTLLCLLNVSAANAKLTLPFYVHQYIFLS